MAKAYGPLTSKTYFIVYVEIYLSSKQRGNPSKCNKVVRFSASLKKPLTNKFFLDYTKLYR